MKNKIYKTLAAGLSASMMFSMCMPVSAASDEIGICEKYVEENIVSQDDETNVWKGNLKEGTLVYFNENGELLTGLHKVDKKTYLFNDQGFVQTGWKEVEDSKFYFSKETGERYESRIEEIDGITYSFDENGEYVVVEEEDVEKEEIPETDVTDVETTPEDDRLVIEEEPSAELFAQKGWIDAEGGKQYLDATGTPVKGMQTIEGKVYFFDLETGFLQKGWIQYNGNRYFADQSGRLYQNQMITFGSTWYYMGADGSVQKGYFKAANGKLYYGDQNTGILKKSGWIEDDGKKYFADEKGVLYQNRMITFGKTGYYMGADGSVQKGYIQAANGKLHYGDLQTGILKKSGWINDHEKRYFANEQGILYHNQLITFGSTWYYMGADGSAQIGIVNASGTYYYAQKNGIIRKTAGWIEENNKKYFSAADGKLYKNQFISFGNTYYFCGEDAAIVTGEHVIDGIPYKFENTGIMKKEGGWGEYNGNKFFKNATTGMPYKNQFVTFGKTWYYANEKGIMVSGWYSIRGIRYYFYPDTKIMARNTTIDGIKIGPDGKASTAYTYAAKVLDRVGWNLRAAFNWSARLPYRNYSNSPAPGSEAMALFGFKNGVGDCYVMAATFYYMAELLGYDAHQVTGYVPLLNGGMGVHSWVEIDMNGGTYVFDPQFTNQTGNNGYQIYYGMSGTWRYSNYYRMN